MCNSVGHTVRPPSLQPTSQDKLGSERSVLLEGLEFSRTWGLRPGLSFFIGHLIFYIKTMAEL